jgi:hypothetical protein
VQWTELRVNSKEFTDVTVVDLTEDNPLAYEDFLSQYTTIPSSTCSSAKGASDDDDNKGISDLVSGKSIKPKKSGIKLRLNPPKPPMPKILLRVKQPEQVSSRKCHGPVGKNNRQVRNSAPTTKKPKRKHSTQS